MPRDVIYLDHAATTPVAPVVVEAMLPYFSAAFGNASSRSHPAGWAAAEAVERARAALAGLVGAPDPTRLYFTSGSTEAVNLAVLGTARRYAGRGRHVVTARTEHSAVLGACAALEREGFAVTYLDPDADGRVPAARLRAALRPDTTLAALMWANNETGVLQDVAAYAASCRDAGVVYFCDATQAVGKVPVDVAALGIDALALSAHKFYGPQGVGALYVADRAGLAAPRPLLHGGGQEAGLRPGTLNVPGIVGLGAAAALATAEMHDNARRLGRLRDGFETRLTAALDAVYVNGADAPRLPHVSNVTIRFAEAEALLSRLQRRVAVSTGSACASATLDPSHVLLAMGLDREDARGALRVSLGRDTVPEHVADATEAIVAAAGAVRAESPLYELYLDGAL